MIAPRTSILGFPMQRRSSRRRLVLIAYAALAVVCAVVFIFGRNWPNALSLAIYAAMAVAIFLFGGNGNHGLIKSFNNKPPRPDAPVVDLIKLQLAPLSAAPHDPGLWRNDERELARRDLAHYKAYQVIAFPPMVIMLLAAFAAPRHILPAELALRLIFLIALVTSVLVVTLPSAIILWTEPDAPTDAPEPSFREANA